MKQCFELSSREMGPPCYEASPMGRWIGSGFLQWRRAVLAIDRTGIIPDVVP